VPVDIPAFLTQTGWHFEDRGSGRYLTGFTGENGAYPITIHADSQLVQFVISPYLEKPKHREHDVITLRRILLVNSEMNLCKFGLDEDGDVFLAVEAPAADFNFDSFHGCLMQLVDAADTARPEWAESHE
jgi:hypothetical protein